MSSTLMLQLYFNGSLVMKKFQETLMSYQKHVFKPGQGE